MSRKFVYICDSTLIISIFYDDNSIFTGLQSELFNLLRYSFVFFNDIEAGMAASFDIIEKLKILTLRPIVFIIVVYLSSRADLTRDAMINLI